jgi:hypothetical protein
LLEKYKITSAENSLKATADVLTLVSIDEFLCWVIEHCDEIHGMEVK